MALFLVGKGFAEEEIGIALGFVQALERSASVSSVAWSFEIRLKEDRQAPSEGFLVLPGESGNQSQPGARLQAHIRFQVAPGG